ncbi:Bug family tripartite tricarboxylate transporter substrate binding protein [Cupriavidus alkaliphilus]|uniref:Bug family tripartite tricarboxylate transporter substrate binding protein n=1 Tax=Cupriavidus alkaliphilus TaxID=942866 RepID=UPI00160C3DFF|nr:tripartite tricarboxylate transporter substrate binding protein [Cupriavidus alkaliphilus]MBB3014186.1 tripartite-type tricarboxylate transporter receptor subunit TctC [Cupriavidus alkaliphilus]
MNRIHRMFVLAASAVAACFSSGAQADTYPSKPISIVVPFSAGAGTDLIARVLAEKLSVRIGQPVLVENRVGAAGVIGTSYVAKAPAAGYTLLFAPGSISFANLVVKGGANSGYDPVRDFTPIVAVGNTPVFLVTGSNSGFKTFKDVVVAAKNKKLEYGSAGPGSILHIIGEVVNKETGVNLVHVPYKGVAPAVADVLGGHIPLAYGSLSTIRPYVASGKLVPLAVTSRGRSPLAPDVPSLNEIGYKGIDLNSWYGLFGPKGMPVDVVNKLNMHLNEILKMPDVIERMAAQGASPIGGAPEVLGRINATDTERFGKIIKEMAITTD